ncbi:TonB-dependent receptor [Robertkochia solimangrovi]|uniref:TonB-dependent receptor n=1 Tax=Robertkochia solimangrovi TaxID=2213046 RepID=UPI00117C1126|nr:TonB-dependent receptor [Robertkochia solimangrovi]TRZ42862.1 TonB-dependent receptor [Robertkochia solimangrovi]
MIHKLIGGILYLSICSLAMAQNTFNLEGSVLDAASKKPVTGATVLGETRYAVSDEYGHFNFDELPEGVYEFKVAHMGFADQTFTVVVKPGLQRVMVYLETVSTALEAIELHGVSDRKESRTIPLVSESVNKDFLDKNRANSLMQTLEKIPGVSTINIGSGQSKPVIRGLGFNRVAVVQNGIKHEAQQWGSDHGLEIDQYGIEAIQIIKGPASLMYGSDAIAGVVNIKPSLIPQQNTFEGEVNLLGETNNDLLGVSAGLQSRKEHWYYRGRFTYRDYGDFKVPTDRINYENYIFELHDHNLRNTAGKEANASFNLGYVSDNFKSETSISNVNTKNGFFANAHGLEVRTSSIDYDRSNRDIDLPYHTVNHLKVTNSTTLITHGKTHVLHFDLGYQSNHREEHSEPVPHGYMPKPADSRERVFRKNTFSLNLNDKMSVLNRHELVAGFNLEYQHNDIDGWGFLIPAYQRFSVGGFAYDQVEVDQQLHLQAGIRYDLGIIHTEPYYDWFQSQINNEDGTTSRVYLQRSQDKRLNFGSFSGSLGIAYTLDDTNFKVNAGRSFRMPLANELASDGVNYHMYRYEKGNSELDAEASWQLDLEVDHIRDNYYLGVSPFINYFENYIYLNPTSDYYETLQIYEYTQSEVFRYGGELKAGIRFFERLQLDASGEYVYSRQTSGPKEGYTLPFSPPLSGRFSAAFQFDDTWFFKQPMLSMDYKIAAAQKEIIPPEEITDGYQVMNFSLNMKVGLLSGLPSMSIRFNINNILNTKYFNHTSFYRLIDVPEPGRNFSISINQSFNK